jgi:type IV pilus assembly protein PilE
MKNTKGFTLVELLIVIAIIGILAGVVYPSYTQYVKKAECADGIDSLMTLAGFMEEYYMNNDTYKNASAPASTSPGGYYNLSISQQTAFVFTLKATPVETGQKTLTLNSLGQKGETGGTSGATSCW